MKHMKSNLFALGARFPVARVQHRLRRRYGERMGRIPAAPETAAPQVAAAQPEEPRKGGSTGKGGSATGGASNGGSADTGGSGGDAGTGVPGVPVDLGVAEDYVILAKTGISTVPTSAITGNLGVSPAAASYITGFSLTADSTNAFSTSPQVTGRVYAADYASPTPSDLTTAVSDMELAFTDAAGRAPDVTELGAGRHRRDDPRPGRLPMGHRSPHPDGCHPRRRCDGRLDLPGRPRSDREQRHEHRALPVAHCPRTSSGK